MTEGRARELEFWPDYGGVLLHEGGRAVPFDELDVPADLAERARGWVAGYADSRLAPETRDEAWIAEGRSLFLELQSRLASSGITLVDWEGTWAAGSG